MIKRYGVPTTLVHYMYPRVVAKPAAYSGSVDPWCWVSDLASPVRR